MKFNCRRGEDEGGIAKKNHCAKRIKLRDDYTVHSYHYPQQIIHTITVPIWGRPGRDR